MFIIYIKIYFVIYYTNAIICEGEFIWETGKHTNYLC